MCHITVVDPCYVFWGVVVCVFFGSCMIAVLADLYTLVKSEYVSFAIGMSALWHRSNCPGVVGLCTLELN